MDAVNNYLKRALPYKTVSTGTYQKLRPRIRCADGFTVSVQASKDHYCKPRIDGDCEYEEVELGFPSAEDSLINKYAEDRSEPTDTVYICVPIDVVNKLIEKHGGIVN